MADRSGPDLSRMKNLIGKSWNSWNLPEAATEQDLKKMRSQFKPKETKIPLEHTNPLPTELMYLYGSRPEFDLFSITQCPACKKYYKTQWLNNHFIKNAANEHLCKTTGIVVAVGQVKKKKIVKRSHESRHHNRHRSSHDHHRHWSKKSHHAHSVSKSKRPSLTIISDKKYKDRLSSPTKPKMKDKVIEDKRNKEKSSSKRHSSPKDRRVSNPTCYTLSIPDDKDENIPVKVLLSNKKANRQENKPSLQIISEKPSKILKNAIISNEKMKPHKDSSEKKGKSVSGSAHSGHKHKKTSNSHGSSDHSPSPTKSSLKDDYKFKIPLKSKSSDSRSQPVSFESSKSLSKESTKHKSHSGSETIKANDATTLPKVAYRSPSNILSNSNIPNKHSSGSTAVSSLKIALQNISPIKTSSASESESSVATKGTSSKSYGKERSSSVSAVVSPKHSMSSSKGVSVSKSTSSTSKSASSNSSSKSPSSVPSTKPSLTIISSKPTQSILSPELKLPPISKSSLNSVKPSPPAPASKLSSSKSTTSLSRSSSSVKSSSSSSSSTSKSSSLSPSKFTTPSSSSKGSSKVPTAVSPKSSPVPISKSPSSSSLKSSSSNSSSKSSLVSSAKSAASALPSSKSAASALPSSKSAASALSSSKSSSSKSQTTSSKSSKSHLQSSKSTTPGSNIIMTSSSIRTPSMTSVTSISLSSSSDSLSSYDIDASYIKAEMRTPSSLSSKSSSEVSSKYSAATKDKKSSKNNSSAVTETVSSKQASSTKDRKHSGKHGSNSSYSSQTIESKSPSTEKSSSKDKKSSNKSSLTVISSETKSVKTTPPVTTKKSSLYQSSLTSPTSYKAVSPPPSSSFSSTLPPTYIAPSWTSAFKSSLAQTLTSTVKSPLPSTIQSSSSYSLPLKNSYSSVVHKSPMIASTSSAIQSTIVAASTMSPTLLGEQLVKKSPYGSANFLKTGILSPEVPSPTEKSESAQTHHKKKKKKKDKDERRKIIPLKDRCFHPDQHCGVVVAPSVMPCKRSLTCKTHSIALRRAVAGRSSSFDSLLAAHKKARDEEKLIKTEKKDTLINIDVPEKVEVLIPTVEPPVATYIVSKPVEVPVAPPVIPTVVPEAIEAIATPDSKENEVPEQSESESPEAEPDVIFLEEIPITVVNSKEVKDGTSLFEVSKAHEERLFNVTGGSLKCLTKKQFSKTCQNLKRKMDEKNDCLIFNPKKILLDKEQNSPKKRQYNFVSVRGMPKNRSEIVDEYSVFLEDKKSPESEECKPPGTEEEEGEVIFVEEVAGCEWKPVMKSPSPPITDLKKLEEAERLVKGKYSIKAVSCLRNRHAARRIAAINQAIFADTCANHKMYLLSQQAKMARLALRSNDVERAKRHLTVKRIMVSKDPLSFSVQRLAKWLVRNKSGLSKKGSMFASSHQLVEKCMRDSKHFLSKQYILIRKQLQDRERVKARKRFVACYRQSVRRTLLSSKSKIRVSRKLVSAKQKKLDRHFRLNVYRNLKRIRRHLLKKQLTMLRLAISRNVLYNRQKYIARKMLKSKNSPALNRQRLISLIKKGMLTKTFILNEKDFLKRMLLKENSKKAVKPKENKIVEKAKPPTSVAGQQNLLSSKLALRSNKPSVITVIMPMSKMKAAAMLKKYSTKGKDSVNDGTNNIQNVNPDEFKSLIGSRVAKSKIVSPSVAPGANSSVVIGQNKCILPRQTGQNILHNPLITARDILSLHRNNIAQPKKKILFGRSCKIDEQILSDLRQRLTISKKDSKSELPSLTQINSGKVPSCKTLMSKSNQHNKTLPPGKVNISNPPKNSKSATDSNLKEQKDATKLSQASRPVAKGNKKGISNNPQANSSSVSQPATPNKSKPLKKKKETKISSSNEKSASGPSSTDAKSKGKSTDVSGSEKINPVAGSLVSTPKNSPHPKLCRYRVVSQNGSENLDATINSLNNKNVVAGKKLEKVPHCDKKVSASANIASDKPQEKNDKIGSVKKVVAQAPRVDASGKQKSTKDLKNRVDSQAPSVKNLQAKAEPSLSNKKGIETNSVYSKKQASAREVQGTNKKANGTASSKEENLQKVTVKGNENVELQRNYVMTLLAVKKLITEKSKSGEKKFSEQESKLIKLYLKYQSSKSRNTLIANCLMANGNQGELYKKLMAGST